MRTSINIYVCINVLDTDPQFWQLQSKTTISNQNLVY